MLYLNDNNDVFPFMASKDGPLAADWIYWEPNLPQYPIQNSPIAVEMRTGISQQITNQSPATVASVFKCPADLTPYGPNRPYPYSYTFNDVSDGTLNLGFSSCGANSHIDPPWEYFRSTSVRNGAQKMMMSEEPYANNEAPPGYGAKGADIQCGHWEPLAASGGTGKAATEKYAINNILTIRHSGWANANFGDGHATTVLWTQATNALNVVAAY